MSTETIPAPATLEVMPEETQQFVAVAKENQLSTEISSSLQQSFQPAFAEARKIMEQSRLITVTDANNKLQVSLARECRLALRKVRTDADKKRKSLKDESLRTGRAIDGFFNILVHLTEPEEIRLEEQEKFAERQEADRRAALKQERIELLKPYVPDVTVYMLDAMTPESFRQLLDGAKHTAEVAAEAARKIEADRIAREAADLAERQKIAEENARLKREADEKAEADKKRLQEEADERARVAHERNVRHATRTKMLAPYRQDSHLLGVADMDDEVFAELYAKSQNDHQAALQKAADAAAAEEKRIAAEHDAKVLREALQTNRAARLAPYGVDTEFMDLAGMDDEKFTVLLTNSKAEFESLERQRKEEAAAQAQREADEAAAKKRHADALAEERRKADEIAAASLERERIAKAEKAKADAELARIQKEEQDRKDAETKRKADEEKARQLALAAPDADKVRAYRVALSQIPLVVASTPEGIELAQKIAAQTSKYLKWLDTEADKLAPKQSADEPDFN